MGHERDRRSGKEGCRVYAPLAPPAARRKGRKVRKVQRRRRAGRPFRKKGGQISMLGAIFGDIVGSRFEFHNCRSKEFELFHEDCGFTDDSLMTLAVADALTKAGDSGEEALARQAVRSMRALGQKYPHNSWGRPSARGCRQTTPSRTEAGATARPCASRPSGGTRAVRRRSSAFRAPSRPSRTTTPRG